MKKILLLIFAAGIFSSDFAQSINVTATLGTVSASYPTLKAAFDNINNGVHQGTITIYVIDNTTEAASAILNTSGVGSASYTGVTIQPSGGVARTISGSFAAPLIDLNGADNVTINGLNTGGNSLDISNASTSSLTNTSTIRFILGATNNTVTNCIIEGSATNLSYGTIFFSTATGSGNDGNTISNNTITSAGTNLPFNGIYSAGTSVAVDNSSISILNNNIQNYYNPTGASNGIFIASNSSAWTITGNKFFQTANRTATVGAVHHDINILTASGTGYTVNNNTMGFANASGTGITTYNGAVANLYRGIEMTVGTSVVSNIQGNQIAGINFSTTSASALPGIFSGISILGGSVNVGTTSGNTIGTATGNGSITITSTTTAGVITGIYSNSTAGAVDIENNNIGSISTGGTALIGYTFYGIYTKGTSNCTITSNTIGSTITTNSIAIGIDPVTTVACSFNGITNSSTGPTSISANTIQNCSVYSSGASVFNGVVNSGSTGTLDISTNNIISGTNTGTGAYTCISNAAAAATINITSNIIRNHIRTAASGVFTGISNTGAATSSININANQIGNINGGALTFTNASSGTITGISNSAGTATTTVNINGNSLQGFSVVSCGAFIGISNGGALTGVAININSNLLGTPTGDLITYSGANSTPITTISNTGGASTCALSVQSNDFRGIVHSVAGTSAHTYIINSAATLSQNISSNTFTNLDVNTTGAIIFISNNVVVSATETQNVDGNSIVGTYTRTSTSASGALTLFTSSATSISGAVITNNNNNFSNITVSGTATIAGWVNTDAGAGTKTIQGNTFSNWTGGTGLITAMNVNISGTGNVITGNNINNFTSGGNITVITTGAGNDNIYSNTISSISSTGTGATLVNGIAVTGGIGQHVYQNTITGLHANFSNLSGNIQNSLAVNGIFVSGGTTVNVNQNIISGFTADAIDAGTVNGVTVSAGSIVNVSRNKIYDLSSNSTAINAGGISGIFVYSVTGSVTNIINNIIGDIRTPVSGNSDSYRGISINTATTSDINVYFNTIYLNSTSTGTNFGCTGIYHAFSANSLVGKLDLRNNIITNLSAPTGTGITALFRQYGTPLNNYASTSNNNLYYAGTPGPNRVIFLIDPSSSDQTLPAFKARLGNREGQSFTEDVTVNFLSLVGSSPNFLHIDSSICTRLESGGININGITDDYDGQVRQGNPGYTGTGKAPDIGADEFEGNAIPTADISGTAAICNGSSATLSLAVTGTGTISGTLSDGSAFSGTAPTITINVNPTTTNTYTIATLTNSTCTSITSDRTGSAVITVNARPTGVISGTQTICNGSSANLSLGVTGTGTFSGTFSDGTAFSGTAPTITVSVSPATTTTYSIATLTNGVCSSTAGDLSGIAAITVTTPPAATISYSGTPFCSNIGTASVTVSGTSGGTFSSSASVNTSTGDINLVTTPPGIYTVTYTVAASGGCSTYTTTASVMVNPNTWTGGTSTNWNTGSNWAGNGTANTCPDFIILSGVSYQPILNSGTATVQNLFINSGAFLTVTNATLQISGTINNSGTFDASNGTIEINGGSAQTIPANTFQNNALYNLIISNSSASGVSLGGALDIYGSLSYSGNGMKLTTNDNLTLKSTSSGTAWLGDMTGNTITGKATVERYVSSRKAWRFLSVPTNTIQSVKQTWQEGAASAASNPVSGYGIQLSGAGGIPAGFDIYSALPSVKYYNPASNAWVGITATSNPVKNSSGYMVFVRGDRTVTSVSAPPTQTVLRTKGNLYTGNHTPVTVNAGQFTAIGNPYPSAVDMRNITKSGVKDFFYLWDPALAGAYGYGAYQTFSNNGSGNYVITPGGGSYGTSGTISNYIASGQAFFVQGDALGGSVTFKEAAKTTGSGVSSVAAPMPTPSLRVNLYGVNADSSTYITDGLLINYDDSYSNTVDDMDAIKSLNTSENLSIKTAGKLLVVERRHTITDKDTVFLNLTGVSVRKYRLELMADQLYSPGLTAFLQDNYLHTLTPLYVDGTTLVDFSVTSTPASYAANRFIIVFSQLATLPVTFTSVKAYQKDKNVNVEWKVDNELNIKQYEVEKSTDGSRFTTLAVTAATANGGHSASYGVTDTHPVEGYNYYRVKSVDVNDKTSYTNIVKVMMGSIEPEITVYPNPVKDNTINLHFNNQPQGKYNIRLLSRSGQVLLQKQINHESGSAIETIPILNPLPHGIYQLEITSAGIEAKVIKVSF